MSWKRNSKAFWNGWNRYRLVKAMFKDAWDMRLAQAKKATKQLKSNVAEVEK